MRSGSSAARAEGASGIKTRARARTAKRCIVRPSCGRRTYGNGRGPAKGLFGGRRCGLMAHDAELVAVEVAHIGPVVVRVVVLADARRTFVARSLCQRRGMECIDGGAGRSLEGDGDAVTGRRRLLVEWPHHPERLIDAREIVRRVADRHLERALALEAEWRQHGIIESHRAIHL